jgi:hypothetical protein
MNIRAKLIVGLRERSRQAIALAFSILTAVLIACGGGSGDVGANVAAWPGTGGTGITATGPVAGFGSVIVNGTRFEDSTAKVFFDGLPQTDGDTSLLRLGMVANVAGQLSSATTTPTAVIKALGTAKRIEVWSIAQGTISSVLSATTFKVAGMSIVVDAGTVFSGAMSINDLNTQTIVRVWGQPMAADFSQWSATRIEVSNGSDTISTGQIVLRNTTATLNGIVLTGSEMPLTNGQLVRAVGSLASSATANTLTVGKNKTDMTVLNSNAPAKGYAELEGFVTSVVLSTNTATIAKVARITLGATEVDTSGATFSGATIAVGKRVEVQGNWNSGVLSATKVSVKFEEETQEVEMDATVQEYTSLANFVVRGQRCDASNPKTYIHGGSISKLKVVGQRIYLHGLKDGDVVRVTELEIK